MIKQNPQIGTELLTLLRGQFGTKASLRQMAESLQIPRLKIRQWAQRGSSDSATSLGIIYDIYNRLNEPAPLWIEGEEIVYVPPEIDDQKPGLTSASYDIKFNNWLPNFIQTGGCGSTKLTLEGMADALYASKKSKRKFIRDQTLPPKNGVMLGRFYAILCKDRKIKSAPLWSRGEHQIWVPAPYE